MEEAIIYDWDSAVCKIKIDKLYSVVNTDTYPMLINLNSEGMYHAYKIVAFETESLKIERLGSSACFTYQFAEGVDAYAVRKKILDSMGSPYTILRSSSGLRL